MIELGITGIIIGGLVLVTLITAITCHSKDKLSLQEKLIRREEQLRAANREKDTIIHVNGEYSAIIQKFVEKETGINVKQSQSQ